MDTLPQQEEDKLQQEEDKLQQEGDIALVVGTAPVGGTVLVELQKQIKNFSLWYYKTMKLLTH